MRGMKNKIIVTLALVTGMLLSYSVQASACDFGRVSIDADCVEAGEGYKIEYTITANAYIPNYWTGREFSVEYELTISSTSGSVIDTVNGASNFICTGGTYPYIYQIIQNGSVDIPECGEYELSGEVGLKVIPVSTAVTLMLSSNEYKATAELDPFTVTCACDLEGCTPGFWKNHTEDKNWDAWLDTGYTLDEDFDTVFSTDLFDPDITLGEAIQARGGKKNKLARHGTAALLNAAHPDVYYPLTVDEVIEKVQNLDAETLANYNEFGTPGFCD